MCFPLQVKVKDPMAQEILCFCDTLLWCTLELDAWWESRNESLPEHTTVLENLLLLSKAWPFGGESEALAARYFSRTKQGIKEADEHASSTLAHTGF